MPDFPHQNVFARLGPSERHGVGVFAIAPIPSGTNIFVNDQHELIWIDESIVDDPGLTTAQRKLYEDFTIRKDGKLGCPQNFNLLTVSWYLNEPEQGEEPNMAIKPDYQMVARREIAPGEELTIIYNSYSDPE